LSDEGYKKYNREAKIFLSKPEHQLCKARIMPICKLRASQVHHKKGRGIYLMDKSTWLPVCDACHKQITIHSKEAIEKGFSDRRNTAINRPS